MHGIFDVRFWPFCFFRSYSHQWHAPTCSRWFLKIAWPALTPCQILRRCHQVHDSDKFLPRYGRATVFGRFGVAWRTPASWSQWRWLSWTSKTWRKQSESTSTSRRKWRSSKHSNIATSSGAFSNTFANTATDENYCLFSLSVTLIFSAWYA